jgi:hypothetical protein
MIEDEFYDLDNDNNLNKNVKKLKPLPKKKNSSPYKYKNEQRPKAFPKQKSGTKKYVQDKPKLHHINIDQQAMPDEKLKNYSVPSDLVLPPRKPMLGKNFRKKNVSAQHYTGTNTKEIEDLYAMLCQSRFSSLRSPDQPQSNNIQLPNIIHMDKTLAKNSGGGGNFNSNQYSLQRMLKDPRDITSDIEKHYDLHAR